MCVCVCVCVCTLPMKKNEHETHTLRSFGLLNFEYDSFMRCSASIYRRMKKIL